MSFNYTNIFYPKVAIIALGFLLSLQLNTFFQNQTQRLMSPSYVWNFKSGLPAVTCKTLLAPYILCSCKHDM